jgi:hypothetical protein
LFWIFIISPPAPGVERADDPVAHLVVDRELRVWIPDVTAHDLVAEGSRDVERSCNLTLLS